MSGQRFSSAWFQTKSADYAGESSSSHAFDSKVSVSSSEYQQRYKHNKELVNVLETRLHTVSQGGSKKSVELLRERGKLLPRERIAKIIDPNTQFLELSPLAAWGMYGGSVHSAGYVTGVGVVQGVECMFFANDSTVKGGVFFPETTKKQLRAQQIAMENHLPCIYLVDGGGANLGAEEGNSSQGSAAAFTLIGRQFYNQAVMSSMKIPQLSAVLGKCTAGGAYIPAMSDESVIVKGNGTIYLGGPPLVKAATGEDAEEQELGGAAMHTSKSGVSDHYVETELEGLQRVRVLVEHLSRRPRHILPMSKPEPPKYDPDEILGLIPENDVPFDVHEVIARIVDGSRFHEFKPRYGSSLVCGFAHLEGFPVGIVANNGALCNESAIKATHFVQVCGQRGVPLTFLHNTSGFQVGTQYEQNGVVKDGAKMIMAVSCAPVPKFSVVIGGSHGAGNYVMCGAALNPRFIFLWPNAKISSGPLEESALVRQDVAASSAPQISSSDPSQFSAYDSSRAVWDDGIIDPRQTRAILAKALSVSLNVAYPTNGYGVFRM